MLNTLNPIFTNDFCYEYENDHRVFQFRFKLKLYLIIGREHVDCLTYQVPQGPPRGKKTDKGTWAAFKAHSSSVYHFLYRESSLSLHFSAFTFSCICYSEALGFSVRVHLSVNIYCFKNIKTFNIKRGRRRQNTSHKQGSLSAETLDGFVKVISHSYGVYDSLPEIKSFGSWSSHNILRNKK